jgi:hypothetical protein
MLSYFHFALSPISTKLIITHPRAARYQLARSPRIQPSAVCHPASVVPSVSEILFSFKGLPQKVGFRSGRVLHIG